MKPQTGTELTSMYFVAIVLPQQLNEKIIPLKQWMKEGFGAKVGLKSPAHITLLAPFWMAAAKEEAFKNDMLMVASAVAPFQLRTQNFSAFVPRTIFIAVEESAALQQLKQTTDRFFQQADYKIKKESRRFHPHITIATRDITKNDFDAAWPYFQHKEFREDFVAKELSLLKHNGRIWDVHFTTPFRLAPSMDAEGQP